MKSLRVAIAAAASLFAASASADTVKVGLIANFTGGMAVYGSQFQQGIQAYPAINGTTVKGPKGEDITIEFLYRDATTAGPARAKQLAEELVLRDKVNFLAGFDLPPAATAVGDSAAHAQTQGMLL